MPAARRNSSGFSLVELMIVVSIIGLVAGVVIARYQPSIHDQLKAAAHVLAAELTYAECVIWKQRLYGLGIDMTFDHRLERIEKTGNRLKVVFANETTGARIERSADQIVVEHGTVPVDELYYELRAHSANDGVTDIDALLACRPQPKTANPDGRFELHRIGDAVASRNIHAAVLDAFRLSLAL